MVLEAVAQGRFVRDGRFAFTGFQLYRSTGMAAGEAIGERVLRLRKSGDSEARGALGRDIVERGLFDPIPIGDRRILAVNLTADRWTRGGAVAAVTVEGEGSEPQTPRLRLACMANAADLPLTVTVDDGQSLSHWVFEEAGFLEIELARVEPGKRRLYLLWTDPSWVPGPQDLRQLGVKLFPPLAEPRAEELGP